MQRYSRRPHWCVECGAKRVGYAGAVCGSCVGAGAPDVARGDVPRLAGVRS